MKRSFSLALVLLSSLAVAFAQTWTLTGPDIAAGSDPNTIEYYLKNDSTNSVGYCSAPLSGTSFIFHFNNGNPDGDYTSSFGYQGYGGSISPGQSVRIAVMQVVSSGYWSSASGIIYCSIGSNIGNAVPTSPASIVTTATAGIVTYHVSDITVPTYTNYTFSLSNTDSSRNGQASWYFNGGLVKQVVLLPGQSDSWTTPGIEVTPTPQDFTASQTMAFPTAINPNVETNGLIDFSAPAVTQSNAYSPSAPPNTSQQNYGAASQPLLAPTNIVTFGTPTGSASESTLAASANVAHQDAQNTLLGLQQVNQSITSMSAVMTNALGQQYQLLYSNVFLDGQWLPKIYGAITNLGLAGGGSNGVSIGTNVWVMNFPTNRDGTLIGISNLLAATLGSDTNDVDTNTTDTPLTYQINPEDTNAVAAIAAAQADLGSDFNNAVGSATNGIASYLSQTIPAGSMPNFTISMPLAHVSFDMNPVTRFPWFFLFVHAVMTWLTLIAFVTGVVKTIYDMLQDYAAAQTTSIPSLPGGGGGGKGTILQA